MALRWFGLAWLAVGIVVCGAQTAPTAPKPGEGPASGVPQDNPDNGKKTPETHLTPAQAKELFRSVDDILHFASSDSKLPVKHEVKRKLQTRTSVEKYVVDKFNDDEDAKRMQRSEIVLKKFGLLDRDFQLKPFLVSLLTEQIAGYYDSKTKTVNLLDWIAPDSQKPVLAHELTHALQDQHVDLDSWENKSLSDVSKNVEDDNKHLAVDEVDTAREAVLEGQAMAVFVDYSLKGSGKTLLTSPNVAGSLNEDLTDNSDSPVMARAPLLLQESLLFPYREGLNFEQVLMKDKGLTEAFAGVLDRPPSTSFEILNPKSYERQAKVPLLQMPDVHGLLDNQYAPYDIGVMGALDVRILTELFAGEDAAVALTPQWDGGIYYAAQSKMAKTPEQKAETGSVALMYLSAWKSPDAAKTFAAIYAEELGRKYSGVKRQQELESNGEQIYQTNEGPVLIALNGNQVFTSESFELGLAHKLEFLMEGAQSNGNLQTAQTTPGAKELSGAIVHVFANCGLMRVGMPH
ncbi:hypothetical protein [Acidisarcina polymorpha]|nr:hypothetical protein [Acidisarcina polymorpha]